MWMLTSAIWASIRTISHLALGVISLHLRKALYERVACELSRNLEALADTSGTIGDLRIGGNNVKPGCDMLLMRLFSVGEMITGN